MSLIVPPWGWAHCSDNLGGVTPSLNAPGTGFTAGNTGADGASVTVLDDLAHDCHLLSIGIAGLSLNTANGNSALDVLVDPAGGTSWSELIADLVCGMTQVQSGIQPMSLWYHFPIYIPAGTAIGVRAKTEHTADLTAGTVIMRAFGEPSRPGAWWCGSKVETLGISDATGTTVTPGSTGTWGSWTNVGSTTSGRYGAVALGINGSDGAAASRGYHWQLGYGSNPVPGIPTFFRCLSSNEFGSHSGVSGVLNCDIAEGTQMQVRGTSDAGGLEPLNFAVYGVH